MSYVKNMNKTTQAYLDKLLRRHGTFGNVAAHIGVDERTLRRHRNESQTKASRNLITAMGKILFLKQVLKNLIAAESIPPNVVRKAAKDAKEI